MDALYSAYKLAFELSPIIFTGGIATNVPGGALPIITFTEAVNFTLGILSGAEIDLDNFFAHFAPIPGATLIDEQAATYTLANQTVAANATIIQPLNLSMLMTCPARNELGYPAKLATMMALKTVMDQHSSMGGTYTVITPSFFYTNGILLRMVDASNGASRQPQNAWQLDFYFPLLTLEAAQTAQNSLISKITGQTQVPAGADGSIAWSGLSPTVGNPSSLVGPSIIPAGSALPGTNTAPF